MLLAIKEAPYTGPGVPISGPRLAYSRKTRISGQGLIEFVLVLPLLLLLAVNAVNFGAFLFAWITIANAARAGADYLILGSAAVSTPVAATAAQVTALVTSDISSLPNRSSLTVRVCMNNNGTLTCTGSGSSVSRLDPEPSSYIAATVDVTYTYQPPISLWSFPGLGIQATIPSTTIHRQAVMRMLQ